MKNTLMLKNKTELSDPFDNFNKMIDKFFLGFPDFNLTNNSLSNFPPYNIYTDADGKTVLELACAGFKKEDLTVSIIDEKILKITGSKSEQTPEGLNYSSRGIAARDFTFERTLMRGSTVESVNYQDGVLKIVVIQDNYSNSVKQLEIN